MLRMRFNLLSITLLFVALLTGCSTTQIKSVWKDPAYMGRPNRVMVIAVSREPITRRIVEDEFVLQLKTRGVDAIASYSTLPDRSQDEPTAIAKMVVQLGADAVLVTRLVSKRSVRVYYPAAVTHRPHYYGKWPEYYRYGYESINTPGYMTKYEFALMETNLYDATTDNLLWAATTETGVNNLNQTLIKPYIGSILNIMAESGVLKE